MVVLEDVVVDVVVLDSVEVVWLGHRQSSLQVPPPSHEEPGGSHSSSRVDVTVRSAHRAEQSIPPSAQQNWQRFVELMHAARAACPVA
jgi:hypothetical protein